VYGYTWRSGKKRAFRAYRRTIHVFA